ncbi:MAG: homocysteine S-methyltransferase family protein [Gammaproteobacteria bacterium]|nr:homocysteine S-methyltransferase family protein [Gammaproteobacteria bacterium]
MNARLSWLEDRVNGAGAPLIIDGGTGTELERAGVSMDGQVWSGRAVMSHPQAVLQVHEAFIAAGAEVIITNTFATARHMLEPGGLGEYVSEINLRAVRLAQQARDSAAQAPVAIAGSICEWVPTKDPKWHQPEAVGRSTREQAEILVEAGVDLIALEMCEQIEFSIAAIDAVLEFDIPVWIGMSARRHQGQSTLTVFDDAKLDFEDLVKALSAYPAMMMNIMHTPVPDVDEALAILKQYWNGPIGVYPESGYFTMPDWQFVDIIEPDELAQLAEHWVDNGVRMVGGCCGLGPEHIAALRQTLK